jgi:RNA-dependent RNA polymerase
VVNALFAAKDYDRAVKCYFVCTESLADIDLEDPSFKFFTRIHAARCHIMHIHTVPIMAKFASRSVALFEDLPNLSFCWSKLSEKLLCSS